MWKIGGRISFSNFNNIQSFKVNFHAHFFWYRSINIFRKLSRIYLENLLFSIDSFYLQISSIVVTLVFIPQKHRSFGIFEGNSLLSRLSQQQFPPSFNVIKLSTNFVLSNSPFRGWKECRRIVQARDSCKYAEITASDLSLSVCTRAADAGNCKFSNCTEWDWGGSETFESITKRIKATNWNALSVHRSTIASLLQNVGGEEREIQGPELGLA